MATFGSFREGITSTIGASLHDSVHRHQSKSLFLLLSETWKPDHHWMMGVRWRAVAVFEETCSRGEMVTRETWLLSDEPGYRDPEQEQGGLKVLSKSDLRCG